MIDGDGTNLVDGLEIKHENGDLFEIVFEDIDVELLTPTQVDYIYELAKQ
jgi:hypothetical protein